jgi:hypothetical protein
VPSFLWRIRRVGKKTEIPKVSVVASAESHGFGGRWENGISPCSTLTASAERRYSSPVGVGKQKQTDRPTTWVKKASA